MFVMNQNTNDYAYQTLNKSDFGTGAEVSWCRSVLCPKSPVTRLFTTSAPLYYSRYRIRHILSLLLARGRQPCMHNRTTETLNHQPRTPMFFVAYVAI